MDDLVVRLVVGSPEAYSATIRIWSPRGKSDIYAGERGTTGQLKISLHRSGECLAGLTTPFAASEPDAMAALGGQRAQSRWRRLTHVGSRFVVPFQFSFPASELSAWCASPPDDPKLTWLPTPAVGRSILVTCGFSGQTIADDSWPGRDNGVVLLASKLLPNGEKAWVLWQDCETNRLETDALNRARERMATGGLIPFANATSDSRAPRTFIFVESIPDRHLLVIDSAIPGVSQHDRPAHEGCS